MSTYKKRSFVSRIAEVYIRLTGDKGVFQSEEKTRKYMEERKRINSKGYEMPKKIRLNSELSINKGHNMQSFILSPNTGNNEDAVVLYFHGGAYVNQPVLQHFVFLDEIAIGSGMEIHMPIYPKAPNVTCSESMEVLLDYYRNDFLHKVNGKRIIFMGDSAGGGLALAFYERIKKEGLPLPTQLQLFSPWVDLSMEHPEVKALEKMDPMLSVTGLKVMGRAWAGELDSKNPSVSPLYGDLEIDASVRIFVGTREILLPDSRRLRDLLLDKNKGKNNFQMEYHEEKDMNHVYVLLPIPEGKEAIQKIVRALRS